MERRERISDGEGPDFVISDGSLDRHGTRINQSGVYEIVNKVSGKRYIGSAKNILGRWRDHKRNLRNGAHKNRHLQSAWTKHGESAFVFSVLLRCAPERLIAEEQAQIDLKRPEYNLSPTAGSTLGTVFSDETRQKLSAALKGKTLGRKRDASAIEKTAAARRGTKLSEETRQKISAALKGRKRDPGAVERTASALRGKTLPPERVAHLIGNTHALGARHTEEQKAANSARQMGRPCPKSPEHRAKISAALKGFKHSAEANAARAARQLGKTRGPYKTSKAMPAEHANEHLAP